AKDAAFESGGVASAMECGVGSIEGLGITFAGSNEAKGEGQEIDKRRSTFQQRNYEPGTDVETCGGAREAMGYRDYRRPRGGAGARGVRVWKWMRRRVVTQPSCSNNTILGRVLRAAVPSWCMAGCVISNRATWRL